MQIRRLTIEGFRSYRRRVSVDFNVIRAAVISGENGAGKSSLLEALLWGLYGWSRSDGVDNVISKGATVCAVEVEWSQGSGTYRVRRMRGRTGVTLELYRADDDGQWVAIADEGRGAAVRRRLADAIQDQIVAVIGADLETLRTVNILTQGDASRFTQASPGDRRAMLRTLLGVDRFSVAALEATRAAKADRGLADLRRVHVEDGMKAADLRIETQARIDVANGEIRRLERRLVTDEQRLHVARVAFTDATEALGAARATLAAAQERARVLPSHAAEIRNLKPRIHRAEAAVFDLEPTRAEAARLPGLRAALESALLAAAADGEHRVAAQAHASAVGEYERTVRELADLDLDLRTLAGAPERLDAARKRGMDLRAARESGAIVAAAGLKRAERERVEADAVLVASEQEAARLEREVQAARLAEKERSAAEIRCLSAIHREEDAIRRAAQAADLLGKVPCPTDLGARCFLLADARTVSAGGNPEALEGHRLELSNIEARAGLFALAETAHREAAGRLAEARTRALLARQELRRLSEAASSELTASDLAIQNSEATIAQETAWVNQRDAKTRARAAKAVEVERLAETVATCAAEVEKCAEQLRAANEARARIDDLREQIKTAEAAVAGLGEIERATAELPGLRARVEVLAAESDRLTAESNAAEGALHGARRAAESASADVHALAEQVNAIRPELDALRLSVARMEDVARECAERVKKGEDAAQESRALLESAALWDKVAIVLGLAPTLLIEAVAAPALARTANEVLARISSNGLALSLETQRTSKQGDKQIEVIEIVARDNAGVRSYEDFSGGERFRIDIALRLALSNLIAQRDGVPLDFLIIDEGFGCLDAAGVASLKEVLGGLQSIYGLLLVVTHLPEVGEMLPRQLVITKDQDSSTIQVL